MHTCIAVTFFLQVSADRSSLAVSDDLQRLTRPVALVQEAGLGLRHGMGG